MSYMSRAVGSEAAQWRKWALFAIVLVGGQGSIPGVLLGTALMFVLPQVFRDFAQYRYLVFGFAMILVMVLRPQGLWPRRGARA